MDGTACIRKFRWDDLILLTGIFNDVNGIALGPKAFDVELLRQVLSQPNLMPEENCMVAELDGSLVGFGLTIPEVAIGRAVFSGGVVDAHRGRGIGRSLMRAAVARAESLGSSVLHVQAADGNGPATHILTTEGFRPIKRYVQMTWTPVVLTADGLPDGFSLRSFRLDRDEKTLTDLQNAAFDGTWGFCPNTVSEISARVRFKISPPKGIIFLMNGSTASGYVWTARTPDEVGSIGFIAMTGVHPDYRGMGLGKVVVAAGLYHLKAQGVGAVELEVDSENVAATGLYGKLGFEKIFETRWYERRFGEP